MKEIWKLLELLNEYLETFDTETNKTLKVFAFEEVTKLFLAKNGASYRQERVISKRFKFIKWLVENDKIDRKNWDILDECMGWFDRYPIDLNTHILKNDAMDMLIMILSIQDNPISFILSILK